MQKKSKVHGDQLPQKLSVQVCIMLKKLKRLPITFQNFVVTDPCNDLHGNKFTRNQ